MTIVPGGSQPHHSHMQSEQIWIALTGSGELKLASGDRRPFERGQVARFAEGDIHGFKNTGELPFVYLFATAPPIDFSYAYETRETANGPAQVDWRIRNQGGQSFNLETAKALGLEVPTLMPQRADDVIEQLLALFFSAARQAAVHGGAPRSNLNSV